MTALRLLKYHALGNDFLVLLDEAQLFNGEDVEADRELARRLCDRRRGVGADGLLVLRSPAGAGDVAMDLRNADGSPAETSGNGLRCLALALVDAGRLAGPRVTIETKSGLVVATVSEGRIAGCAEVSVSMGTAEVGPILSGPAGLGALASRFSSCSVSIGNPHLVLLGDELSGLDIASIGPELEGDRIGGQNVEAVAPDGAGGLELVVWERGAGLTEACGSGSCAAAAAARARGMVGDHVIVRNPGGTLAVDLSGSMDRPTTTLSGPACRVATVDVDHLASLRGLLP